MKCPKCGSSRVKFVGAHGLFHKKYVCSACGAKFVTSHKPRIFPR